MRLCDNSETHRRNRVSYRQEKTRKKVQRRAACGAICRPWRCLWPSSCKLGEQAADAPGEITQPRALPRLWSKAYR